MRAGYETGTWWALVAPTGVIVLPPDADDELVDALWDDLEIGASLGTIVDALTVHVGGVLAAIPPFAAVMRERSGVRVAVRGRIAVRVETDDGERTFTGAEVTTWSEQFVADAEEAEIVVDEAVRGRTLPVGGGVLAVTRVTVDFGKDGMLAPGSRATAQAAGTPVPQALESPAAPDAEPVAVPDAEAAAEPEEQPGTDEPPAEQPGADESADAAGPVAADEPEAVDHTVVSVATLGPEATTVAPPIDAPAAPAAAIAEGDHDGSTITLAELRAMRGELPAAPASDVPPPGTAPTALIPEIASGRIRLSTGQTIELDRPVIIGRRPRSTRASGATMPRLVAVDSPEQDISRNHLEIRPEAGACVVIDLHTTNGTTLRRPGVEPLRLHPGEQTVVVRGDVVDLGDGVTVAFEELS